MWNKIKQWYNGEEIAHKNDPNSSVVIFGFYTKRHWSASVARFYSTLGWFNDPVLNTFVYRSDAQLANLIFHELAHQKFYIKNDTLFNESFATVVAREGVKRWLLSRNDPLIACW